MPLPSPVARTTLVVLLAGLALTRPAPAQGRFEFVPLVGFQVPTAHLFQQPVTMTICEALFCRIAPEPQTHTFSMKYKAGMMVGGRFVVLPPGRLGVEGTVTYARSGQTSAWGRLSSSDSDRIISVSTKLVVRLTSPGARTSFRLGLGPSLVGRVDDDGSPGPLDIAGIAGAGVAFRWTPQLALRFDLEDRIFQPPAGRFDSQFDPQLQHDCMVSVGLAIFLGNL